MSEVSRFWTTNNTGDGPTGGYSAANFAQFIRESFMTDLTAEGVLRGIGNNLAVSGTSSPVAVNTGAAMVYGFFYSNDGSVNVSVATPTTATRIDRVVLRVSWAAQTVRIALVAGAEGGIAPALTQTANTTWEIPLANVSITTGGVITVTDARTYVKHPGVYGWLDEALSITGTITATDQIKSTKSGGATSAGVFVEAATYPSIGLRDTGASANNKVWDITAEASDESLRIRAVNDAASLGTTAISIQRTGTTIDEVRLHGPTTVSGAMAVTGNIVTTGNISATGTIGIDSGFYMDLGGGGGATPLIAVDTNDYIDYDRSTNAFRFVIGGTNEMTVDANGIAPSAITMDGLVKGLRRQGGSSTDWSTPGTTNYTPGAVRMQAGYLSVASNPTAVTFPVAFSQPPLVFVFADGSQRKADTSSVTASGFNALSYDQNGSAASANVRWLAIGTE
jgi:hypothetical protein